MIAEAGACVLLAFVLAADLSSRGLRRLHAAILALLALAPLAWVHFPGLSLLTLGAYALGTCLARAGAGDDDRARLPAALAAGFLSLTGPFGAVGAAGAITLHALSDLRHSRAESLLVGVLLLFVPLTMLFAVMAAAFFETGDAWGIEAGGGVFIRGPLPTLDEKLAFAAAPLLLPLLLALRKTSRASAAAPLAVAGGGLAAALLFMTPAPLPAFFIAASLLAAAHQPRRQLPAVLAGAALLAGIALLLPAERGRPVPLAESWRLISPARATPLAWGAPALPPGAPLPRFLREDGRYIASDGR